MKPTKKAKCNKDKVAIRYGVAIPEKDLMAILKFDCAKQIERMGKELFSEMKSLKWDNGKVLDFSCPDMRAVCRTAATVLGIIQDAWTAALKEYADATKLPKGFVPKGYKPAKPEKTASKKPILSNEEKGKIRALRKSGLSIKAIGKEIHRAEKVVRDFCKTLPF